MKKIIRIFLIFVIVIYLTCDSNPVINNEDEEIVTKATILNLDFEQVFADGKPKGWYVGGEGYDVATDPSTAYSGNRRLRMNYII